MLVKFFLQNLSCLRIPITDLPGGLFAPGKEKKLNRPADRLIAPMSI